MVDFDHKKNGGRKLAPNIQFETSIKKTNISDVKIDHTPFKSNFFETILKHWILMLCNTLNLKTSLKNKNKHFRFQNQWTFLFII